MQSKLLSIHHVYDTHPGAPTIIRHPEDIFVNVGEQSGLQCVGSPSGLAYQWYKVLMVNSGGNLTELQEILPGESMSTLDFRQVQFSDEGIYQCVVSNSQGMAESNPATVTGWWTNYACTHL